MAWVDEGARLILQRLVSSKTMMKRLLLLCLLFCDCASAQTLAPETEAKLQALCDDSKLADARIGVSVLALGRADTPQSFPSQSLAAPKALFERDAGKRFTPASNFKLYTAALALKSMGAGRRFTTRVRAVGKIEKGVLKGDLVLEGAGDPSLDFVDLADMAKQVRAAGINKVIGTVAPRQTGRSTGDGLAENFYNLYPDGWTMDDALWYYGPEVAALSLHRNQLDITVQGGATPGDEAVVVVEQGVLCRVRNHLGGVEFYATGRAMLAESEPVIWATVSTGGPELLSKSSDDLIQVSRVIGGGALIKVSGKVAPGQKVTVGVAVPHVAQWAACVFSQQLAHLGVVVGEATDDETDIYQGAMPNPTQLGRIVATHASPPVGELLKKFLKTSDNLYGELLLRLTARADLAQHSKSLKDVNYANHAHSMLRTYLKTEGIDADGLRFSDGSGLSRYNLVTPRATTQLLAAAERIPGGQFFWDAMPIAGVDGTLKKRMRGTPAENNARAKTGTFSIVSCLSGYVTTLDGTRLAVSVMTNFARSGDDARRMQNEIFATLASATLGAP